MFFQTRVTETPAAVEATGERPMFTTIHATNDAATKYAVAQSLATSNGVFVVTFTPGGHFAVMRRNEWLATTKCRAAKFIKNGIAI